MARTFTAINRLKCRATFLKFNLSDFLLGASILNSLLKQRSQNEQLFIALYFIFCCFFFNKRIVTFVFAAKTVLRAI